MSAANSNIDRGSSTDDLLAKLRATQKPSRAPSEGDLVAWRRELESRALTLEAVVRTSTSSAEQLREKIKKSN